MRCSVISGRLAVLNLIRCLVSWYAYECTLTLSDVVFSVWYRMWFVDRWCQSCQHAWHMPAATEAVSDARIKTKTATCIKWMIKCWWTVLVKYISVQFLVNAKRILGCARVCYVHVQCISHLLPLSWLWRYLPPATFGNAQYMLLTVEVSLN